MAGFGGRRAGSIRRRRSTRSSSSVFSRRQGDLLGDLRKSHGATLEKKLVARLLKARESGGTLQILRHGFKFYGKKIVLAAFRPAHGLNPKIQERYEKNRLVVTRQVHFDPNGSDTLDLVLSLNGIPVATAELKTPSTGQTVRHAVRQYKKDRPPNFPLLRFKKGALVHFAVDTEEVYMTTRLAGEKTSFLPFNKGNEGGAGNPPNPKGYRTSYLWEEVWERESFLDLLQRFLHLQTGEKTELTSSGQIRRTKKETLIFPRYHQLDVVRKLEKATFEDGPGGHYLIQHSAGSGKSNSIAWLAHRLQSLHDEKDRKLFHSVVVLTDRKVLDKQLQQNIYEMEHMHGVVERIDKSSAQLRAALERGTPIIVSTIQKFFVIRDFADKLPYRNYAVIVDEAHSSQTGEAAQSVRVVLGAGEALSEGEEAEEEPSLPDTEEEIARVMSARRRQPNLSFYAFTATPKFKTLELFGQRDEEGKPRPFHLYSMRQAIEEGFILDVLQNYTTYKTYFRLANLRGDREVGKRKARAALARFVRLHPHNIAQKTEVIIEHFRQRVRHKIGGRAKAMVVASSRQHVVRYKEAFDRYLKEKGYTDIGCLVAFSGTVVDETGKSYTEVSMNEKGISDNQIPEAFSSDAYQILLVANKFQTGFVQPLLHTMYVDKRLAGVQAVQTLSRLNRTAPEKEDTFVLDFVNERQEIFDAFAPYYEATGIEESVDPNRLYDLQSDLDASGIYHASEVEAFAKIFYKRPEYRRKTDQAELFAKIQPAVDRYKAGDPEEGERFRSTMNAFVNLYSFVSQVMDFSDRDLEVRYSFGRFLLRYLPRSPGEEVVLDHDVALESYRISRTAQGPIVLREAERPELKGPTDSGTRKRGEEEKAPLSEIISLFNQKFGAELGEADRLTMVGMTTMVATDLAVQQQAAANNFESFSISPIVKNALESAMLQHLENHGELVDKFFSDREFYELAFPLLVREIYEGLRREAG